MLENYKNKLIAHRGIYDNIMIPENSLYAFKKAIIKNLAIELDIHLTKDNNLVVFHDHSLKRMTSKNSIIEDLTVSELKSVTLLDTKEKIPTLEEALKLINGKVPIIIEIKSNKNEKQIIKILLKQLNNYNGTILIQSFKAKTIKLLKKAKSKYKIGLLISEKTDIKICKLFQKSVLDIKYSKPDFLAISKKVSKRNHLKKYINKLPILIWTIKNKEEIIELNGNYIYICDNLPYKNIEK